MVDWFNLSTHGNLYVVQDEGSELFGVDKKGNRWVHGASPIYSKIGQAKAWLTRVRRRNSNRKYRIVTLKVEVENTGDWI